MRAPPAPSRRMTAAGLILLLLVIAVLIFCSALFSGLETALFSLKAHQLRRLEDKHPSLKNFIQVFRDNPRRVLNVLLLGDVLVNIPLIVLCLFLIVGRAARARARPAMARRDSSFSRSSFWSAI